MNMNKLITTAFLLMALANVSYGQDVETITFANGSVYVGEYNSDGKLSGEGTFTFADGSVYVGEFRK
tara:strand:+ start:700 stop:900 length:201 start_codon:yes stop_codon:yes gene_type:complete